MSRLLALALSALVSLVVLAGPAHAEDPVAPPARAEVQACESIEDLFCRAEVINFVRGGLFYQVVNGEVTVNAFWPFRNPETGLVWAQDVPGALPDDYEEASALRVRAERAEARVARKDARIERLRERLREVRSR